MNDSIGMNYCAPDANVWAVNLDGRYMSAVQNYLVADGIPTDGVTKIVSNAAQTLSYCPDPEGIGKCQKTGIVIGKVQSGKTSNFISITALAFDNDYDMQITPVFVMKVMLTLLLFEMISLSMRLAKNLLVHQPIKKTLRLPLKMQ